MILPILWGASAWLQQLTLYRQAHIKGRLRGGKTLLAVATAQELIRKDICKGAICNIPNSLPLHPWREMIDNGRGGEWERLARDCVFVYDEPWRDLDNRTSMTNPRTIGAFAGKLRVIYLLPSVYPLDKRNSFLKCGVAMRFSVPILSQLVRLLRLIVALLDNGNKWAGGLRGRFPGPLVTILLWITGGLHLFLETLFLPVDWLAEDIRVYKWTCGHDPENPEDQGTFFLLKPSEYFPLYDTAAMPLDDGDIGELVTRTIMQEKENDVQPGRWWIYADHAEWEYEVSGSNGTAHERPEIAGVVGWQSPEADTDDEEADSDEETDDGSGTDSDDYSQIRSIAEPFYGRPNVASLPDE